MANTHYFGFDLKLYNSPLYGWNNFQGLFSPGGGALNFFSGRGVRPGFPKCGACELTFASEKGGL